MGQIYLDYFLLTFMGNLGILQLAAAYAGIKGLTLFDRPLYCYLLAVALIAGGFAQFFLLGGHTPRTIIEGTAQFGCLVGGAAAAIATTILISSVVRLRMAHSEGQGIGLEALKGTTYLRLILKRMAKR
jgi:hypothetical protein